MEPCFDCIGRVELKISSLKIQFLCVFISHLLRLCLNVTTIVLGSGDDFGYVQCLHDSIYDARVVSRFVHLRLGHSTMLSCL